jgi:hypothetical protein
MKTIPVTQYLRPHGEKRQQFTDVSDEAGAKVEAIASSNYSPERNDPAGSPAQAQGSQQPMSKGKITEARTWSGVALHQAKHQRKNGTATAQGSSGGREWTLASAGWLVSTS